MTSYSLEEDQRLRAVRELDLLDRPEEERFRRITRLVRRHFHVSASSISLVDQSRQFSIAQEGLPSREHPRSESVCSLVVADRSALVITNLSKNRRTKDFRLLIDRLKLLFYAGFPLLSAEGWPVGSLCIYDHVPRRFSETDLQSLADFAAIVEEEMAMTKIDRTNRDLVEQIEWLRMRAFIDALTGVWNRGALFDLLNREMERMKRSKAELSIAMLDIDFFKKVNDEYGHPVGDDVLKELAERVKTAVRAYDAVGRYGGEEFLIVFPETDSEQGAAQGERIREAISNKPFNLAGQEKTITVSLGVATRKPKESVEELVGRADQALYKAKRSGRNRVVSA